MMRFFSLQLDFGQLLQTSGLSQLFSMKKLDMKSFYLCIDYQFIAAWWQTDLSHHC